MVVLTAVAHGRRGLATVGGRGRRAALTGRGGPTRDLSGFLEPVGAIGMSFDSD